MGAVAQAIVPLATTSLHERVAWIQAWSLAVPHQTFGTLFKLTIRPTMATPRSLPGRRRGHASYGRNSCLCLRRNARSSAILTAS